MTSGVTRIGALAALVLTALLLTAAPLPADPTPMLPAPPSTAAPVPPPPPPPPPDVRPQLRVAALTGEARSADSALGAATARRARVASDLDAAGAALREAESMTSALNLAAAGAAARYDASRAQVQHLAVLAYMQGDSMSALDVVLSGSGDPLDASRRQRLLRGADAERKRLVAQARADHAEARRLAREADDERGRRRARVDELEQSVPGADQAIAAAQRAADRAHRRLGRWLSVAFGTATPILGTPALSAEELAAWFRADRGPVNTTVTIDQLAALFIAEGRSEGVRGDIAFAQSILETGSFSYPGGGLVNGTDNNFAGVGACDSCAHGHIYPDAQTGVRVQMQYLHVYADRTMTASRFANPPVDPNMDRNFRKGQASTWAGLTHTWATADLYADRIMTIYYDILDWVTAQDR
jgi:hypothetical protein